MSFLAGLLPTVASKVGEFAGNLLSGKGFGDSLEATTKDIPILGSVVKAGNKFFDTMDKKYPPRAGLDKWGYPVKGNRSAATIDPPKYSDDEDTTQDDDDEYDVGSIDPLANDDPMRFKGADPYDVIAPKGDRLQRNVQMLKRDNMRLRGLVRRLTKSGKKATPLASEVVAGLEKVKPSKSFGRFV